MEQLEPLEESQLVMVVALKALHRISCQSALPKGKRRSDQEEEAGESSGR